MADKFSTNVGRLKRFGREHFNKLSDEDQEVVIKDIKGVTNYLLKRGIIEDEQRN